MPNYPYDAYGSNPNAGVNYNGENGWGGYQWPGGVPASLLATWSVANAGGTSTLTFRKELQELVTLCCQFGPRFGYPIYAYVNGEYWGPWSYQNRAISGTSSPSNHSRGRAWDINAPRNPYTSPLVCDMPPAFVNALESVGWCWGGRYSGSKDAMHFEYGYRPENVAGHVAKARQILGGAAPTPTPPPDGEDDDDMAPRQIFYVLGTDGTVYASERYFQTRVAVPSMKALQDALWNALNVKLPDGSVTHECYLLSGGKWVPFTNTDQLGKADKQAAQDQFGILRPAVTP